MRFAIFLLTTLLIDTFAEAQSLFGDQIARHRDTYKAEFLTTPNSPLKSKEALDSLRFYEPDSTFSVVASVLPTPDAQPFELLTFDGKAQPYVQYALLSFSLNGRQQQLALYRSLNLARIPKYRDYLFLPFKDDTSGKTTYGGGRYMDFRTGDVQNGRLTLDFNKAYNPYCAYRDGYSCPIPPPVNRLSIAVNAGEMTYGKGH